MKPGVFYTWCVCVCVRKFHLPQIAAVDIIGKSHNGWDKLFQALLTNSTTNYFAIIFMEMHGGKIKTY